MEKEPDCDAFKVLLVEDSKTDAYVVIRALSKRASCPCDIIHAHSMKEAEQHLLNEKGIDIVLLDLGLPDTVDNHDTFKRLDEARGDIPVIVLTSVHDHALAVGLVDSGAADYVRKASIHSDPEILCDAVDFAVCRHKNVSKMIQEKDQVIGWMRGTY
ncbi:MAG: response regulator [Alphaproteobacteria bacterium]|nr:response regulator [Alphaproteobacteria bacterium]